MDYMALIQAALASMVMAGGYSLYFAISKINKGEAFEKVKFIKTVIIGCVVGLVAHFTGHELTQANYQGYLSMNGIVVVAVDNLWSIGKNYFENRK